MSKDLVHQWLESYMFKDDEGGSKRAESISAWLANHKQFKSHSRHLSRDTLIEHGLEIRSLEADEKLQDSSLSVFHAATRTLGATPAVKIVENHDGRAFIKQHIVQAAPALQVAIGNGPEPSPPAR